MKSAKACMEGGWREMNPKSTQIVTLKSQMVQNYERNEFHRTCFEN